MLISAFLIKYLNLEHPLIFSTILVISSLLPDIDSSKSKISIPIISRLIENIFGHRRFFHSIFPSLIFLLLSIVFSSLYPLAIFLGYLAHLLIDALTKEGIMPLFPITKIKINGFIRTNSFMENILFLILIILNLLIFFKYL
ncbi:metal-dependent hydrolase [Candidatus Woesearchaeota archaeon]|nr:metal-dependent hydrolase [Candidatus Woesearchaeota archaeon]